MVSCESRKKKYIIDINTINNNNLQTKKKNKSTHSKICINHQ